MAAPGQVPPQRGQAARPLGLRRATRPTISREAAYGVEAVSAYDPAVGGR